MPCTDAAQPEDPNIKALVMGQILKDRVIDDNLKHQTESGNLYAQFVRKWQAKFLISI